MVLWASKPVLEHLFKRNVHQDSLKAFLWKRMTGYINRILNKHFFKQNLKKRFKTEISNNAYGKMV